MKWKFLFYVAAVLVLNSANCIFGSMVVSMVDATNIQTMPFIVRTDTSGNAAYNNSINFYVVADPKGPPYAPDDNMHFSLGGARLSVYDRSSFVASNFISSCSLAGEKVPSFMTNDVSGPLAEKGVSYEFAVCKSQLTNADFEILYVARQRPAVDSYRFVLPTFVPEPSLGLVLGNKDDKILITSVSPDTPAARAGLSPGLIIQQINDVDCATYGFKTAQQYQDLFKFGIVDFKLIDPTNGKTNDVVLTTAKIFPPAIH